MKISYQHLRQLIREEYYSKLPANHIDGQPFPGTFKELSQVQTGTWGHGEIANTTHVDDLVKKATAFAKNSTKAKEKRVCESFAYRLSVHELRRLIREALLNR
jgi:hypothetical protein